MHPRRELYSQEIFQLINQYCERHALQANQKNNGLSLVLGLSEKETKSLINKTLIALPDCFFYLIKPELVGDLQSFIAQQYLLFQVQENINDELFPILFINFTDSLIERIVLRYNELVQ